MIVIYKLLWKFIESVPSTCTQVGTLGSPPNLASSSNSSSGASSGEKKILFSSLDWVTEWCQSVAVLGCGWLCSIVLCSWGGCRSHRRPMRRIPLNKLYDEKNLHFCTKKMNRSRLVTSCTFAFESSILLLWLIRDLKSYIFNDLKCVGLDSLIFKGPDCWLHGH